MKLSIGILSFNTKDLLRRCLTSIFKHTQDVKFEVVVVDNGSQDRSAEMVAKEFPQVKLIKNKKNNFFARGYNQAFKTSLGEYFLMLNSDTYIENNSFKILLSFMEQNNIVACEGLEIDEKKKVIRTGTEFPSPLIDFYELSVFGKKIANKDSVKKFRMESQDRKKNFEVDVGCNAFFCVKKEILNEINGYDENFKLYYTESDICLRIKEKGYKIYHCGSSYVVHTIAASTKLLRTKRIAIYYKDLYYYYRKYNHSLGGFFLFLDLKFESYILQILGKSL